MLLQHTVENWCCRPHKHIVISAFTVLYFWVLCFLCFFGFFFWPQPQTSPRLPFLYFNNDYAKRAVLMSQHGSHYHISHTLFSGFSHARRGKEAEKVAHILVVLFSLCAVITSKGKFSSFGRSPTKRITAHNRWSTHTQQTSKCQRTCFVDWRVHTVAYRPRARRQKDPPLRASTSPPHPPRRYNCVAAPLLSAVPGPPMKRHN